MIDADYTLENASWDTDRDALCAVRLQVFQLEQQVPAELEIDEHDPRCWHVLARDQHGTPIGTGRLASDGKIGRMAVLAAWRERGLGAAMLRHLLELARLKGLTRVYLYAQTSAQAFYAKAGFAPYGATFEEAGIEHQAMALELAPLVVQRPAPSQDLAELLTASDSKALLELLIRLLGEAKREFLIVTRDLERGVLGHSDFVDAARAFATRGLPQLRLAILVIDPGPAIRLGHRLVDLARRLPSVVQLRRAGEPDRDYPAAFVLNDAGGYYYRESADRAEGHGHSVDRVGNARLRTQWNALWDRSEEDPELRQLSL